MADCINAKPGTIGYIDSGHGHSVGLEEIDLENLQGTFLNSKVANERDGIAAAVKRSNFPDSTTDDFGDVNLVNAPGANTWPIVQMTYVYVRRNLTYMMNPNEQSLLIAFLRALQDDEYVGECAEKYAFTLPSAEVRAFAKSGIDLLEQDLLEGAQQWTFENETMPLMGAGTYVISPKRQSIADVEREEFAADIELMQVTIEELTAEVAFLKGGNGSFSSEVESFLTTYVASKDTQLTAALVLASLSFVFWVSYLLFAACRYCSAGQASGKAAGAGANGTDDTEVIQA